MASNKLTLAPSAALTITLNSLAAQSARASRLVDNATSLYLDAHVSVKFTLAESGKVGDHGAVNVYAYGSEDGSPYGPSGGPSAKEAIAVQTGDRRQLFAGPEHAVGRAHRGDPYSDRRDGRRLRLAAAGVAQAFGGTLPRRWHRREHRSGVAFAGTGCSASYSGIFSTTA